MELVKTLHPLKCTFLHAITAVYAGFTQIRQGVYIHNDRVIWLAHHAEMLQASRCAAYAYDVMLQADYW